MDIIDAHDAHNPFTGIFELEILAKLAKLFSDVLQWGGGGQTWNLSFSPCPDMMILIWSLEWVTLGWFFQIALLQAGMNALHTKEQEKYRSYMFYVNIFQRFWTFVLYNYTLQLQGKNGQNKPENPQNWNMAKIAPKSDKFTK